MSAAEVAAVGRPKGWALLGPAFCGFDDRMGLYHREAADTVRRWLRHYDVDDICCLSEVQVAELTDALADLDIEGLTYDVVNALVEEQFLQTAALVSKAPGPPA